MRPFRSDAAWDPCGQDVAAHFDRGGIRAASVGGRSRSHEASHFKWQQAATLVDMRRSLGPFPLSGCLKKLPFAVAALVVAPALPCNLNLPSSMPRCTKYATCIF